MNSTLLFVVVLASVMISAQGTGEISKHDKKLAQELDGALQSKVSSKCTNSIVVGNIDDDFVDNLCNTVHASKASILKSCTQKEYTVGEKIICSKVNKSNDELADKNAKYSKEYAKLSSGCIKKLKLAKTLRWFQFEAYCTQLKAMGESAFKTMCPNANYGDAKETVCGGSSGLLVGLATLVVCLMASFLNKL